MVGVDCVFVSTSCVLCVEVGVGGWVGVHVYVRMRVCVCACMRVCACGHACVSVCMCVSVFASVSVLWWEYACVFVLTSCVLCVGVGVRVGGC